MILKESSISVMRYQRSKLRYNRPRGNTRT